MLITKFTTISNATARDRVYHSLLLLGSHSSHWRRRLNRAAKLLTRDGGGGLRPISPGSRSYCGSLECRGLCCIAATILASKKLNEGAIFKNGLLSRL